MSQAPLTINGRNWMRLSGAALAMRSASAQTQETTAAAHADLSKISPDKLLLKDYRPKSIYKIPRSEITRAKFPVVLPWGTPGRTHRGDGEEHGCGRTGEVGYLYGSCNAREVH
jgi:hypothetical protein